MDEGQCRIRGHQNRLTNTADVYFNQYGIGKKFLMLFLKIQKDIEIMTMEKEVFYQENLENYLKSNG